MMRRKGKRFISAGLSLLLCLGMAACGNTQTGDAQKETQGNEAEDNERQEKPELVFWELPYGPADTYEPALQKIIDEYNSGGHSTTVRLQMLSWSGFMEQYQTSIAAGSPPDITSSISYRIANWIEAGEVLDITDIVEKWEQEDDEILDDFLPGTIDIGKKDGRYYALPYVTNGTTVYYRTDILEDELGFTDLDQPVTWEKLFEMCEAVKQKYNGDIIPFSFCTLDQNSSNAMINVLFSNGTSWINEEGTGGALDDPKALECMEFFKTMKENEYFPEGMVTYNQADLEKLYQSGKVAMVWNAPASHVAANEELMSKTRMMGPIVGPSADEPRYVMRTGGIMGFAQTKYPEETKEFIEWFAKNNLGVFTEGHGGLLPLRESYFEDPFFETDWEIGEYSKYTDYYEELIWPSPFSPAATDQILMENIIGQPEEALLMGSADPKGDLAKAQESINNVFESYNSN